MLAFVNCLAALLLGFSSAQQFPSGFVYDYDDIPTLSSDCLTALNRTVECNWLLAQYEVEAVDLSTDNLTTICTPACYRSLADSRKAISSACPVSSNKIISEGIAYPATQQIDSLLDVYNKTCLIDQKSQKFCYDIMRPWQNQTVLTKDQECSPCLLGLLRLDQSSDFSYNGAFSEDFSSLTSSCGATGYEPSVPVPIALNSTVSTNATVTATPVETPTSSCVSTYTVKDGDTCNGICRSHNVSTYSLVQANGLAAYCNEFPKAGTKLCMPASCDIYLVNTNDTCYSIALKQPTYITVTQLQAWNLNLNGLCTNMKQQEGMQICVGPPGDSLSTRSQSSVPTSAPATPVPQPTNAANGTNTQCAQYHNVTSGDTCSSITIQADPGISLVDFYFLNKGLNQNCTNLILGESYCIQPVGDIATYPGYGSSYTGACTGRGSLATCYGNYSDLSPTSFEGDSVYPTATTRSRSIFTPQPTAPGTSSKCAHYIQWLNTGNDEIDQYANKCSTIADLYGITEDVFIKWNPSLKDTDPCTISKNYRYCVVQEAQNGTDTATSTPVASQQTSRFSPSSTTTSVKHSSDPLASTETTAAVTSESQQSNTSFESNKPTTTSINSSSGVSTPSPYPTEMVAGCTKFYKAQSGDYCSKICEENSISVEDFTKWNPDVKSDCSLIMLGYYYCTSH